MTPQILPTILIVDDQPQNLDLLEAHLGNQGYVILKASGGVQALDRLAERSVDLVLLDVMMPGIDGFQVMRKIRLDDRLKLLPVILVTALQETQNRILGIEAGCDDFISKPVDKLELLARVRSLLKIKAYHDLVSRYQSTLEAEVSQRTKELEQTMRRLKAASHDTAMRLSLASEYKDEDTGTHIKRMSLYSVAIAQRLGQDENALENLRYAAPLHDLGKIGIPDRILLKPTALDPVEWEIMKKHTLIGAEILKGSDAGFLRMGETIALSHHERWDGNGYPRGLSGQTIPLAGRITAVADVFDALTSSRPYKDSWGVKEAFRVVEDGVGTHFDPKVVAAFRSIKDGILKIKAEFQDEDVPAFSVPGMRDLIRQYHPKGQLAD